MKNLSLLLLIVGVAAWFFWPKLFPPPPPPLPPSTPVPTTPAPAVQTLSLRLSPFVEKQIDAILGPLDSKPAPLPRQELRALKEQFRDEALKYPPSQQAAFRLAITLCDTLLSAMDARDSALASLADSAAKERISRDRLGNVSNSRPFFDAKITSRWTEQCGLHRRNVEQLYSQLREAERRYNFSKPISQ